MINYPTTRILAILELLQTHGKLSGSELAKRISVDRRTIRRYIALLEEVGIPITTERGPLGGYALVAGYKLPPMMFTNDEALALSLGLAAVQGFGITSTAHAIAGAQAKLERVMPAAMKARVRSIAESVSFAQFQNPNPTNNASLSILSSAAHNWQGVHMQYRNPSGDESQRDFDPYGLAFYGSQWYAVGFCHLRKAIRSFRLDRVESLQPQPRQFKKPTKFDVIGYLTNSIATLPRKFTIEVLLKTNLESARRELFQAIGVLEPFGDAVLLRSQADNLDWFARELARLPWSFEIRQPAALAHALNKHAQALLTRSSPTGK